MGVSKSSYILEFVDNLPIGIQQLLHIYTQNKHSKVFPLLTILRRYVKEQFLQVGNKKNLSSYQQYKYSIKRKLYHPHFHLF